MTYGVYLRTAPRLKVLRGYWGNETAALSTPAKPKADEGIKSGMVISQDSNGEWVKGCAAGLVPHMALQDQTDTDVLSSGLLLGLSCAGQYEFQTGYFDNGQTYVNGSPLKADTAGNVGRLTLTTLSGGADIVGFCSHGGRVNLGGTNNAGQNSEATPGVGGTIYMLTFVARWTPVTS